MGTISHFDMPSSPYYNTKSKEMGDSKLLDEISKLREWWVEDLKSYTDIKNKTINFKEVIMKNLQNKNKEKGKTQKNTRKNYQSWIQEQLGWTIWQVKQHWDYWGSC